MNFKDGFWAGDSFQVPMNPRTMWAQDTCSHQEGSHKPGDFSWSVLGSWPSWGQPEGWLHCCVAGGGILCQVQELFVGSGCPCTPLPGATPWLSSWLCPPVRLCPPVGLLIPRWHCCCPLTKAQVSSHVVLLCCLKPCLLWGL